jgi:hypothetical protein
MRASMIAAIWSAASGARCPRQPVAAIEPRQVRRQAVVAAQTRHVLAH